MPTLCGVPRGRFSCSMRKTAPAALGVTVGSAMRELETLRQDARRAYERGRLQTALRVGVVIAPTAVVCVLETGAIGRTVGLALSLWVVANLLRWRLRDGFSTVNVGLRFGALPLAAALILCRFRSVCPPDVAMALCGTTGLLGGGLLGRSLGAISAVAWQQWVSAAVVAVGMATLAAWRSASEVPSARLQVSPQVRPSPC